jgi:outer membrane receptor protein involved in Fe transport
MAQEQAGDADDSFLMEEVIVTATRRSQSVQDIPFNISAVSGDYIAEAGLLDATELMREVPGVAVADGGGRAAETNARNYLTAPTVSVYIGDTPMYANFVLRDIERVEVLRGPQSTLYGSGSLGGTVRYIMNRPDPTGFEGKVYGEFSQTKGSEGYNWNADAMLNIPLSENSALRFSLGRVDDDGVIDYVNAYKLGSDGLPLAEGGDILNGGPVYYNAEDADTVEVNWARALTSMCC